MAARKARIEGAQVGASAKPKTSDPVPGDNGKALERIAEFFRAEHPDEWEALRLCPLQHGILEMAKRLG